MNRCGNADPRGINLGETGSRLGPKVNNSRTYKMCDAHEAATNLQQSERVLYVDSSAFQLVRYYFKLRGSSPDV